MKKYKIDKNLLIPKKGFYWENRYSKTMQPDNFNRWACLGYYNGFCICWISGSIINIEKTDCDIFQPNMYFPISSNYFSFGDSFENLEDAKQYVEDMFNDFKILITENSY